MVSDDLRPFVGRHRRNPSFLGLGKPLGNEITQTFITIARDLHCWQVNLSWVPFGKFQSYAFFIGIKSSLLKDLRVNRTRSFFDN